MVPEFNINNINKPIVERPILLDLDKVDENQVYKATMDITEKLDDTDPYLNQVLI